MFSTTYNSPTYFIANVPLATVTAAEALVIATLGTGGTTATAAEINTIADGISASVAEKNNICDGSGSYVALTSVGNGASYTILAADSGKKLLMPDSTTDVALVLPAPVAGLNYTII